MSKNEATIGFAIALAWPETFCKQPGAWYDGLFNYLKIAKNNYYKVGHAAVVLIDCEKSICHYFDFGRYHAPFQHGRVRSNETDEELKLETKALFSNDTFKILNFSAILIELQSKEAFHGAGMLHASYTKIDFKCAYEKALLMQKESPIAYGPFKIGGSNCSRFVNSVILAGKPSFLNWFKLNFVNPFTPTPLSNINALSSKMKVEKQYKETFFKPTKLSKTALKSTLAAPMLDQKIPSNAKWLSGEGAGSWYVVNLVEGNLIAKRFTPTGQLEFEGEFQSKNSRLKSIPFDFMIAYKSNDQRIILLVDRLEHIFERVFKSPII